MHEKREGGKNDRRDGKNRGIDLWKTSILLSSHFKVTPSFRDHVESFWSKFHRVKTITLRQHRLKYYHFQVVPCLEGWITKRWVSSNRFWITIRWWKIEDFGRNTLIEGTRSTFVRVNRSFGKRWTRFCLALATPRQPTLLPRVSMWTSLNENTPLGKVVKDRNVEDGNLL